MNVFYETIQERKTDARSAQKKKNGSKTHKVMLPSDNLTPSQLKKLNGKVEIYHMKRPITWDAFKALPTDLKKEYIDMICEYHITPCIFAEALGISKPSLMQYLRRNNIHWHGSGTRTKKEYADAFWAFWNDVPKVAEVPEEPLKPPYSKFSMTPKMFSVFFDGTYNAQSVIECLGRFIKEGEKCNLKVEIVK